MTDAPRARRDLRRPSRQVRRRRAILAGVGGLVFIALVVGTIALLVPRTGEGAVDETPSAGPSETPTPSSTPTPTPTPTPTFDTTANSIDDPASIWVVVDKLRPLNPASYAAPDLVQTPVPFANSPVLRQVAADAVVQMFAAYTAETGLQMQVQSAYRSYDTQVRVYGGWVAQLGQEGADLTSARPGFSEHQTGLALDISSLPAVCPLDQCFADTPQGQWLAANAYRWGFILRYPNGLTGTTGYEFEPWHYRYVGVELATEMHTTGVATLEEFFGLPAAPTYAP